VALEALTDGRKIAGSRRSTTCMQIRSRNTRNGAGN
jgi:hypothetical protein